VPVLQEARRLVDEGAVSPVTRLSELVHGLKPGRFDLGDSRLWYPECQEHGVQNLLQMATTNVCMAVAVGNSFPLLSDLDATTQRLEWLREDRPIGWTTAPANATAAPMKQLQGYAMSLAGRRQGLLGMIELPVRRQIAPILATIRIAKHNLLVQYRARTACDKILPIRRVC